MALKIEKTLTDTNLNDVSGEYWRICKLQSFAPPNSSPVTMIGLELWKNKQERENVDAEPLIVVNLSAPALLESRALAYAWIKLNVDDFSDSLDV